MRSGQHHAWRHVFALLLALLTVIGLGIYWLAWSRSSEAEPARLTSENKAYRVDSEIGSTPLGTPIESRSFGYGERCILVLGGIHGDEAASTQLVRELETSLTNEPLTKELMIVVIPVANPDGLKSSRRQNSRGVDINRNFAAATWSKWFQGERHYPGTAPNSEPETQAIVKAFERHSPGLVVSVHAPLECINWDGPAEQVASRLSQLSGYRLMREIGYRTPGSLGAFLGVDRGVGVITMELGANESESQTRRNVAALRTLFEEWVEKRPEVVNR